MNDEVTAPLSLLFVCTGNLCRSPMAEVVATDLAVSRTLPVVFDSAGTAARNGSPMHPLTLAVLEAHGHCGGRFTASYLAPSMISSADVVLAFTRSQRSRCQQIAPIQWKKIFTLKEFVQLSRWGSLNSAIAARTQVDATDPELDIADPIGGPRTSFESTFSEIRPLLEVVVSWVESHGAESKAARVQRN
ncbi:arsenate reductase/protein-tyrosine-phosphatase family protein [Gordonia soli]|uniref:arsenate reductase/protein-tyrosine-phosphatase family protein n=1 Tax=Gordonia soli TaxID=320799 RepID=UPI000A06FD79|nr:hypothetical protein [Gordonia soli]